MSDFSRKLDKVGHRGSFRNVPRKRENFIFFSFKSRLKKINVCIVFLVNAPLYISEKGVVVVVAKDIFDFL
jgi:hypothetical protein